LIEKNYPPRLPDWISTGGDNFEVVIASEALYIRNLVGSPFPDRLKVDDLKKTRRQFVDATGELFSDYRFWETDALDGAERKYLTERMSAPSELLKRSRGTGLFLTENEASWLCLNTTDYLRFRFAIAGSNIETAYRNARNIEEELQQCLPFAYSDRYGFLTAKPAECGTGLMLRFLVHIPGVIFSNGFRNLRESLLKTGSVLRSVADEAMSSDGHLFVIQTAHTLGIDEEEILTSAQNMIEGLIEKEYEARDSLMTQARYQIEDRILRGIGVLTHARMIACQEGYALANALRLGAAEGILNDTIDVMSATELFVVGQPAHLKVITGEGNRVIMDTHRADLFREYLNTEV